MSVRLNCPVSRPANAPRPALRRRVVAGLIFEMTNVLYDATLWRREVVRLLARLGIPACYPTFFDLSEREYLADVHCGFRQFEEAFQAFLLAKGLAWGQIDEIEAASRVRRKELEQCSRPLPGVTATIAQLSRQGLPLAVLTDSPYPADRLEAELGELSVGGCFQAVLSSFDLEATKPAAACYQAAIAASICRPRSWRWWPATATAWRAPGGAVCGRLPSTRRTTSWPTRVVEILRTDRSLRAPVCVASGGMIAPVKENPVARRRSPLQAARLAVADALLAPETAERTCAAAPCVGPGWAWDWLWPWRASRWWPSVGERSTGG